MIIDEKSERRTKFLVTRCIPQSVDRRYDTILCYVRLSMRDFGFSDVKRVLVMSNVLNIANRNGTNRTDTIPYSYLTDNHIGFTQYIYL